MHFKEKDEILNLIHSFAIVVVVVLVSVLVSIIITILLFLLGPNWVDKHFLTTKGVTKGFLELILIPEGC